MATNRKDTQHGNFKDFYIYWRERLQGLNVEDNHLLEHFQDMLPPRASAKLDVKKVNTLKKFNSFIKSLDDRELQWYDTKSGNSLEKRKMLLQKKRESKKGAAGGRSSYHGKEVSINQISGTQNDVEEESSTSDF